MNVFARRALPVFAVVVGWVIPVVVKASAVSLGLMPYPVNLGATADPASIPLGFAPGWTNHGYGLVGLLNAPVPAPRSGWEWKNGIVTISIWPVNSGFPWSILIPQTCRTMA